MQVPFARPYLTEQEAQNAYHTILSGWVTQGKQVQTFENMFAQYVGAEEAVAVSSCTAALHLALVVAGVGVGDEVICPSLSYIATANSIGYVGAKPVFAEVGEDYNLTVEAVKTCITPQTKAIVLVHQMGMPADLDAFKELCEKHQLILIEDAACAIGSKYKQQKIGNHADLVCFSFHPRKVITTGDGGMISTSRKDFAEKLRRLRQHGMVVSDLKRHEAKEVIISDHIELGYNYRLTDIQAAVGIAQLEKLDWIVEQRRRIAHQYHQSLNTLECVRLPLEKSWQESNYQSYSIYLKPNCPLERNELMQKLLERGIATRSGIMTAHRETAYKTVYSDISLPVSENLSDRSILLPLFVSLTSQEQNYVISELKRILTNKNPV